MVRINSYRGRTTALKEVCLLNAVRLTCGRWFTGEAKVLSARVSTPWVWATAATRAGQAALPVIVTIIPGTMSDEQIVAVPDARGSTRWWRICSVGMAGLQLLGLVLSYTRTPLVGLAVPPDFPLPEGYVRHHQVTDDGQDMILTGDANFVFGEALAFLAWLMPQSHWVTIYRKSLRRAGAAPMLLPLRLDRNIPAEGPPLAPVCSMPDTGMMCSVRRHAGERVGRDVADAIARGLDGVHFHRRQFGQDVGGVLQLRPVQLHVLARREVTVAAVVAAGDVGDPAQLAAGEHAVGHGDAQHGRIALHIEAVLQAQRAELVLAQLAGEVTGGLVTELRDAVVDNSLVVRIVTIHFWGNSTWFSSDRKNSRGISIGKMEIPDGIYQKYCYEDADGWQRMHAGQAVQGT